MAGTNCSVNQILLGAAIVIWGVVLFPYWLSPGMFFDGVTYAAVANNWSKGIGEFWVPFYHHRDEPFIAHPPLLYVMLGSMYRLLGSYWWVEELYNFLTFFVSMWITVGIYKKLSQASEPIIALPVFFLAVTPLYSWAFRSTLLDNTVTVFVLLAVFLFLNYLFSNLKILLAAGIACIIAGFLVKGPPALFPLMFLPAYTLLFNRNSWKHRIVAFIPLLATGVGIALIILFSRKAEMFFNIYLHKQVFASIQGVESSANGKLYLLQKLILELLPMGAITLIVALLATKNNRTSSTLRVHLFLLTAVAASLPLLISQKQRAFYLVPSLPFFAITFSMIIEPYLTSLSQKVGPKTIKTTRIVIILVAVLSVATSFVTRTVFPNDAELIKDIQRIAYFVTPHSTIRCSKSSAVNWKLVAYAARYGGYTLDYHSDAAYYLSMKGEKPNDNNDWIKVDAKLTRFDLYKKREPGGSPLPRPE